MGRRERTNPSSCRDRAPSILRIQLVSITRTRQGRVVTSKHGFHRCRVRRSHCPETGRDSDVVLLCRGGFGPSLSPGLPLSRAVPRPEARHPARDVGAGDAASLGPVLGGGAPSWRRGCVRSTITSMTTPTARTLAAIHGSAAKWRTPNATPPAATPPAMAMLIAVVCNVVARGRMRGVATFMTRVAETDGRAPATPEGHPGNGSLFVSPAGERSPCADECDPGRLGQR